MFLVTFSGDFKETHFFVLVFMQPDVFDRITRFWSEPFEMVRPPSAILITDNKLCHLDFIDFHMVLFEIATEIARLDRLLKGKGFAIFPSVTLA